MSDLIQPWHIIVLVLLLALYFAPSIVATRRSCKATDGIVIVNLFLGWTFVGWVVALAWAASGETKPKTKLALFNVSTPPTDTPRYRPLTEDEKRLGMVEVPSATVPSAASDTHQQR